MAYLLGKNGLPRVVGGLVAVWTAMAQSAHAQVGEPAVRAKAAIVIDADSGKTIWSKSPDLPLPPASTTKILTAIVQLEALPGDAPITISPAAAGLPGTGLGLKSGQRFTSSDLLAAELLESDNRAAAAVGQAIDADPQSLSNRLNEAARRHGAPNVRFSNPHGLDDPSHVCTARDLAMLARDAMRLPEFARVAGLKTAEIPANETHPAFTAKNRNELLEDAGNGVDGIKTGWTPTAGFCFVGTGMRNGRRLITVVLNSPDWKGETLALLNYGSSRMTPQGSVAPGGVGQPRAVEDHEPPSNSGEPAPRKRPSSSGPSGATLGLFILAGIAMAVALAKLTGIARGSLKRHKDISVDNDSKELVLSSEAAAQSSAAGPMRMITFVPAPFLKRRNSREWTVDILDDESRLADPHLRAVARHCAETHADALHEAISARLSSGRAWIKFAAADLIAARRSSKAEKAMVDLLDDDAISEGMRTQASDRLISIGQDRHEEFWLGRLLREGDSNAARALIAAYSIESETQKDLRRALDASPASSPAGEAGDKVRNTRCLLSAVLAVHGAATEDEPATELSALTPEMRDGLIRSLQHPAASRRASQLLDGWRDEKLNSAQPEIADELLLPALQIASLRMGFGEYPQEVIGEMLRRASGGESAPEIAQYPELEPLSNAYANEEMRAAVGRLLSEEGAVADALCRLSSAEGGRDSESERIFWLDKLPNEFQNVVALSLKHIDSRASLEQLALLADSPSRMVRSLAASASGKLTEMEPEATSALSAAA